MRFPQNSKGYKTDELPGIAVMTTFRDSRAGRQRMSMETIALFRKAFFNGYTKRQSNHHIGFIAFPWTRRKRSRARPSPMQGPKDIMLAQYYLGVMMNVMKKMNDLVQVAVQYHSFLGDPLSMIVSYEGNIDRCCNSVGCGLHILSFGTPSGPFGFTCESHIDRD